MEENLVCGDETNTWTASIEENQIVLTFPIVVRVALPTMTWANFRKLCEMFFSVLKYQGENK